MNNSKTYHIHIKGIVQGVGFRPFVYKKAVSAGLNGTVQNG
ncbi:MAG: acylphosphatase, partial [Bacteroidia bacterium]|nr:acylphosphatase [Bacteroidia bacterium]